MSTEKDKMLTRSVDVLVDKARVTAGLAKAQRKIADQENDTAMEQHLTAQHLEALSEELAQGAKDLKERTDALSKKT
jgi:hypothetical protein